MALKNNFISTFFFYSIILTPILSKVFMREREREEGWERTILELKLNFLTPTTLTEKACEMAENRANGIPARIKPTNIKDNIVNSRTSKKMNIALVIKVGKNVQNERSWNFRLQIREKYKKLFLETSVHFLVILQLYC